MAKRAPLTILLDTNFMLIPLRFKVDVFSEFDRLVGGAYQCAITPAVLEELSRVINREKSSRTGKQDLVIELAKKCKCLDDPLQRDETVDDQIARLSTSGGYAAATTDAELRRRLREASVPVFYLRQRKHLGLDGTLHN